MEVFGVLYGKEITSESPRSDLLDCIRVMIKQSDARRKLSLEEREFAALVKKAKAKL